MTGNKNLPNQINKDNSAVPAPIKPELLKSTGETQAETTIPAAAEKSRILAASLETLQEAEYKIPVEKKGILSEEEALKANGHNVVALPQTERKTIEKPVLQAQPVKTQIPARIQEYGNKMEQMRKEAGQQNKAATGITVPSMPDTKQAGLEKAPPQQEAKPQPPNRSQKAPEKQIETVPVKQTAGTAKTD